MHLTARFLVAALLLLAPGIALADTADPLDTFTLTGDGHTFQFTVPSTDTVSSLPHIVETFFSGDPGTVDGVGGYTFGATVAAINSGWGPVLMLNVDPLPPGTVANPSFGLYYRLYGSEITTLIATAPNPDPLAPPSNLLTFMYTPGDYALLGYDTAQTYGSYTLDIAAAPATTATTPEPASWLFLLTGVGGLAALRRRLYPEAVPARL